MSFLILSSSSSSNSGFKIQWCTLNFLQNFKWINNIKRKLINIYAGFKIYFEIYYFFIIIFENLL